jgi:flagellar motor switch protein FliM
MIAPYDFRKPVRLSTEWQHQLAGWYTSAAALATRAWAKELASLKVSVGPLDMVYAQDGLAGLAATALGYRVLIADGRLPSFLALPRLLILQLIGVMLGDNPAAAADRELTLVEENLADYFLVHLWLPFFRESWPGAGQASWELKERETNPQASRFFAPRDSLVVLPWQIHGPWGATDGLWFFQKSGILETLGDGRTSLQASIDDKTAAVRKQALVNNLSVRVEFTLGTAELNLSQLSRLQVGDLLLLDQRNEEGVSAAAGGQILFRGRVGRVGSWKAFRIDSFIGND